MLLAPRTPAQADIFKNDIEPNLEDGKRAVSSATG